MEYHQLIILSLKDRLSIQSKQEITFGEILKVVNFYLIFLLHKLLSLVRFMPSDILKNEQLLILFV